MDLEKKELSSLKYISNKIQKALAEKEIYTVNDLLRFFPIRYEKRILSSINDKNVDILVKATIVSSPAMTVHRENLSSISFMALSEGVEFRVTIFNRKQLLNKLTLNKEIYLEGKYERYRKQFTASNIFFNFRNGIEPVYGINLTYPSYFKTVIQNTYDYYGAYLQESLPEPILKKYHLLPITDLVEKAHFPKTLDDIKEVNRRTKYEEFFLFELLIKAYQKMNRATDKEPINYQIDQVKDFIKTIPFELTDDQKKAVNDVFRDMKNNYPANRLIQGDVGSGKTIVASIAFYAVKTASYQGAFMAPTEILANQHYHNLCEIYRNVDMRVELLTSSIKGKKRKDILERLAKGEIDVLVGTHALISDNIIFKDLRLVITDEQHRFGVNQRALLRKKGHNPDVVYLTATPIPRTLAISAFGDMDISSIKAMPSGRKQIVTKVINKENENLVFDFIKKEISLNHQAYIIAPLVENSEAMDLENVNDLFERVSSYFDGDCLLVHGKMKSIDKDSAMEAFKRHEKSILVSTTVIEVGVDVKDATVIAIFDAHRFGLSQIHQLRGRVGRNSLQSYCFLLSDKVNNERLQILEKISDGFLLSEEDLKLRGPGDFFGNKQSGMPTFIYGDIVKDYNILSVAMDDASQIINNELYKKEEYQILYKYLKSFEFLKKGILD